MNKAFIHDAGIDDAGSTPRGPVVDDANHYLRVAVVFTTPEGTVAALRAAADLSINLATRITLFVAEVVPIHFSLDRPHVPIDFLQRRTWALVSEAGITDEEVRIQICLCRNRRQTLRSMLARHSLVVIGGRNQWWRRAERRLRNSLHKLGHHVIMVETKNKSWRRTSLGRQAAFLRALEIMEMRGPSG
jgi:hypothetical protein